ncbi:uncharacterized protein TNCV_4540231 [Trichonephila clavipes]|nr:uncharacterized protein TNCV_4540231 [Trichonephila clavipes]
MFILQRLVLPQTECQSIEHTLMSSLYPNIFWMKVRSVTIFFKCTPGKIEHCGKKDTSAIGNYILVDFNQVNNLLRSAKCQYCEKQTLKLELGAKLGFSYNLKLLCSNCDENKTVVNTSLKSVQTSHDVNLRITQAFSHIGKGYSAIEKFCMVMNIDPFSSTTYGKCARRLDNAYTLASENIFAEIHREIKNVYENGAEITDLSVSFDGTWPTRGHTSLIGVGCVIDMLTGYVVDFEVMSKVCRHCSVAKNKLGQSSAEFNICKRLGTALRSTVKDCRAQDAKPQHSKCPAGENSWCFYQSAIANGEKPNNHKLNVGTPINEKFLPKILPIYQRLASKELLERCIRCGTQNANESLHSVIWAKCPKEIFVNKRRVKRAVTEAVCEYNKGTVRTIVETQKALGVATGGSTKPLATILDCRKQKFRKRRQNATVRKVGGDRPRTTTAGMTDISSCRRKDADGSQQTSLLSNSLQQQDNKCSGFTVTRHLNKVGLFARRPERCLPLKVDHRCHRLQ